MSAWRTILVFLLAMAVASAQEAPRFAIPQLGHQFRFPRDHGSHPDFRIEWWYITGHLYQVGQPERRFGFQATFFRSAQRTPGAPEVEPTAAFGDEPLYLAHMAILDVQSGRFLHQERLNRAGWDAGASVETLAVHNGPWSLRFAEKAGETMQLQASVRNEAAWTLTLTPRQPLTRFGQEGFSRKGSEPSAASYYLTWARLGAAGTVRMGGEELAVQGEAWMDHEISSSQLTQEQVGWDWAAVQLHDGRELMSYRLRLRDGTTEPHSTTAWIGEDGRPQHFGPERFGWRVVRTWRSPHSGAEYPAEVEITVADPVQAEATRTLRLVPLVADQELTGGLGGVAYWEGACRVLDDEGKEIGSAFLEMTGYAGEVRALKGAEAVGSGR